MSSKNYLDQDGTLYLWNKLKAKFATLASPTFTGTPTAPTPTAGDDSTKIATTAFVQDAVDGVAGVTYTLTQNQSDGHILTFAGSDGSTNTMTIPDNDTTYSDATQSVAGLMSTSDKTKLDAFSNASNYALKSDITNVYKYKGSVATESLLPSSGNEAGDVYDIVAESTYGPAGQNVAWVVPSGGGAGYWDPLGGIFSITSITNQWMDDNLT